MARERSRLEWKVATIGTVAAHSARIETLGAIGSWMWTTSKCPSSSQRLTRVAVSGPNVRRATEPL